MQLSVLYRKIDEEDIAKAISKQQQAAAGDGGGLVQQAIRAEVEGNVRAVGTQQSCCL